MRALPISLLFFVMTGMVCVLQAIPIVGIALMFVLAMFWSVLLVNAGMIGIAIEAATGRVSRGWLLVPVAFYGGYWSVAALDHLKMQALTASFDAANARVAIPFDPERQALVLAQNGPGAWLTQNYALPVAYSANANFTEGFLSHRMIDTAVCAKVRDSRALQSAFVHAFGFHDGDGIRSMKMEKRFCDLSMPEQPGLPQVRVETEETREIEGTLPVTRTVTSITMPDGRHYQLLGGVASPLGWIPMPVMGCGLNSGAPSWDCSAGFWRNGSTPIVSGGTRYGRDSRVLARALGLKPVAIADRKGGDASLVEAKMAKVERDTLANQLAAIDAMIADPLGKAQWDVGVARNHPEALAERADAIMAGVERAAAITGKDRYKTRESGRILAALLPNLPRERFVALGPRILAIYAQADDSHWIWEVDPLMRRLGDLGPDALPYLTGRRATRGGLNGAAIEGLCRVGPAARSAAEPTLLALWQDDDNSHREALFVAMRRIGITPPPLVNDRWGRMAKLQAEWHDVTSDSPPLACAATAERTARQQEKRDGQRRTNVE